MNQMLAAKRWTLVMGLLAGLAVLGPALVLAAGAPPATTGAENPGLVPPKLIHEHLMAMSIAKVVLLAILAGAVFYLLNWAFLDVRFVNTTPLTWNSVTLGGAILGLAAAVLVPIIYVGLLLGIIIFGGAMLAYVKHRNGLVTAPLRVLTAAHWERLKAGRGRSALSDSGPIMGSGRDIIFMGTDDLPIRPEGRTEPQRQAGMEIERVIRDAIVRRASTVGYLARPQGGEVRFRIAGEMVGGGDVEKPASDFFPAILKRMAGLNPDEVRKPQEGRLRAVVTGIQFELRIKTAGTVRGEQIGIRLIDVLASQMRLEGLGLSDEQLQALKDAMGVRPGVLLLSAPKDSGLTTTLHACLRHYDRYVNNVLCFEPHLETEVENFQHVLVDQEDGPKATADVRSRTRMEPDIIAFDSLYLPEVAQILAEAANEKTVVVGMRAVDTAQALTRLMTLFGSTAILGERLQIILNQRVVRLLCPECREAYRPNPEFLRKVNLSSADVNVLYRPRAHNELDKQGKPLFCMKCQNERYAGRTGLFEVMKIDGEVRDMIRRGTSVADIRMHARKEGMRNLQEEGLRMVIDGRTSIEEVLRAIKQE